MKLIDFLVQELPKRGGWPEGAAECCWFRSEKNLYFYDENGDAPEGFYNDSSYDFNLEGVHYKATTQGVQEIPKSEYEEALTKAKMVQWDGKGLPPVGSIVQGLPFDALSYEKPFMFTIDVIHDGCFIGEAMAGGKVYGEFSNWKISPIQTEVERKREQIIKEMTSHVSNFNKTDVVHALTEIYDAITAGKIKGLKVE